MPPLFWLAVCGYLVICAVRLVEADFEAPQSGLLGDIAVCLVALNFAAAWPVRLLARAFRR